MELSKVRTLVRLAGIAKIPMLGYARPRIVAYNSKECIVKIPLSRRTKNHWNSMYLGALAVGADLAAGLPAFARIMEIQKQGYKGNFVFQSMQAEFLKRPDSHVQFHVDSVSAIHSEVDLAKTDGERHSISVPVSCRTLDGVEVATFVMTLSFKLTKK